MLKPFRLAFIIVFITSLLQVRAGAPQGMNYQSVARNSGGQILTNQNISLRLTIHDSVASGTSIYSERHVVQTNAFGTFSVVVGGGSIILGNFNNIGWGTADKYLQVEMDYSGGTNYNNLGASKLISVPYALYAGSAAGTITNLQYDTTGITNIYNSNTTISSIKGVWLTRGNGGLNATNNFIGTTDNKDLILKRGGKEGLRFTTGGALLATGDTSTGVTPTSGAGKRMMWIPAKGAFRAGTVGSNFWDDANIGYGSTAIGNHVMASAVNTVAIGNSAQAICANSIALGNGVITKSINGMVIGTYNDTVARASDSIQPTNVLFQVGNGTSATSRSNALTVGKDGKVVASQLNAQTLTLQQSTVSSLVGNVSVTPQERTYIQTSCTGLPLNNSMSLANGTRIGQVIVIEAQASVLGITLGYGVRMTDSGNLNLSGSANLLNSDTMMLVWDGNNWLELGRSANH